jgi:uncharacterized repeat protein (TIGR01451 family)
LKPITSVRTAGFAWRVLTLLLVASMLFGLGALGTAAGENADSEPSVDPTTPAPRHARETTETPDEEPEVTIERSEITEVPDEAIGRIADEEVTPREDLESVDADALPGPAPSIARYAPSGPYTMGDMFVVEATVTVPAGTTLNYPRIREFWSRYGVEYVDGSTQITDISGTPVSGAVLATGQDQPVVGTHPSGARFVWRFDDPIEAGATDYVFKLSYKVRLTAWDGGPEFWPIRADHQLGSWGYLEWWNTALGPLPPDRDINDSVYAGEDSTDVDQPRLALYKNHSAPFTPGDAYPGWYVVFTNIIENTGFSPAHDMYWEDDLPWQLTQPMLLSVEKGQYNGTTGAASGIAPAPPEGEDITDQVDAYFCFGDPSIDFKNVSLSPDEFITVTYMVWVNAFPTGTDSLTEILVNGGFPVTNTADIDWSTKPGDVDGERVYDDDTWEDFYKDTDSRDTWVDTTLPHFSITKEVAEGTPEILVVGDEITYDMRVINSSAVTATIIPISDAWDNDQLQFVSATIAPDTIGDYMATWNDLSGGAGLAPGESIDFSATFEAIGGGDCVKNRAFIEWTRFIAGPVEDLVAGIDTSSLESIDVAAEILDPIQGNVAVENVRIIDPATISFVKSAEPPAGTIMLPGETITYSIEGETMDSSFSAYATDTLHESVEYVPGSIRLVSGSNEITVTDDPTDGDPGGYDPSTRTIWATWYSAPTETPGKMMFDVTVRDLEFSKRGIMNTAKLYALSSEADETINAVNLAAMPDMADATFIMDSNTVHHPVDPFEITKIGEDVNGGQLLPGDDILWTITVVNTGLTPTTNVVVYDTVPEYTTYKGDSITGTGANDSGDPDLIWNVGQMPVDGVEVLTFISTVDAGTPNGTQIRNQASVESDQSFLTFSDFPTTAEIGDATLLQTGQNDWLWLGLAIVAAGLGTALTLGGRTWLKNGS